MDDDSSSLAAPTIFILVALLQIIPRYFENQIKVILMHLFANLLLSFVCVPWVFVHLELAATKIRKNVMQCVVWNVDFGKCLLSCVYVG